MSVVDLRAALRECRRVLKPGGIVTAHVDYTDHYAHSDPHRSVYAFLQHGERSWALVNPRFHYQNRLRHSDYVGLIRETGFEILEVLTDGGDERDCAAVSALRLDTRYHGHSAQGLAIRHGFFVLGGARD